MSPGRGRMGLAKVGYRKDEFVARGVFNLTETTELHPLSTFVPGTAAFSGSPPACQIPDVPILITRLRTVSERRSIAAFSVQGT